MPITSAVNEETKRATATIIKQLSTGELIIPAFPETITSFNDALASQQSMKDIAAIIASDMAIGLATLKTANAAMFCAGRVPCETIEDAVKRLGLKKLKEIVTSIGIRSVYQSQLNNHPDLNEQFRYYWRLSQQMAKLAVCFGNQATLNNPDIIVERVQAKALCYYVGAIPIIRYFAQEKQKGNFHARAITNPVIELLRPKLGRHMIQRWGLSKGYQEDLLYIESPSFELVEQAQERHCLLAAKNTHEPQANLNTIDYLEQVGFSFDNIDLNTTELGLDLDE
ncbi:HDOD domain-containing protein [Motilimonas eburnea]|uniref:HDOD domain-containing protein n=1 Tax=Motilimonas eburnea TaxID=1737488 RepID=UPI001E5854E0|nr:HDOD domain-containing protein [Motilimonas eburnea]MCE2571737.1 HDOD domain-containing protein [Motilimonas eburnea]